MRYIRTPGQPNFVRLPVGWHFEPIDRRETPHRREIPLRWRMALACAFTGGVLVICGGLLTWLFIETTPIHALQVHKDAHQGALQKVANAPPPPEAPPID